MNDKYKQERFVNLLYKEFNKKREVAKEKEKVCIRHWNLLINNDYVTKEDEKEKSKKLFNMFDADFLKLIPNKEVNKSTIIIDEKAILQEVFDKLIKEGYRIS